MPNRYNNKKLSVQDKKLLYAAQWGHLDDVIEALDRGADIHAGEDSAIWWAANRGKLDVVEYLHKKGADIRTRSDFPVRIAIENNHLEVVKYLENAGCDIHACDDVAMHWAAEYESWDTLEYLVAKGASLDGLTDETRDRVVEVLAARGNRHLSEDFNDTSQSESSTLDKIRRRSNDLPRLKKPGPPR